VIRMIAATPSESASKSEVDPVFWTARDVILIEGR
jgi:hypothetical protein